MARGIRFIGAAADGESDAVRPEPPVRQTRRVSPPDPGAGAVRPPATATPAKMWAGRLGTRTSRRVEEYTTSIAIDRRLYAEDVEGSIAHLHMLRKVGLVTSGDARTLEAALREIRRDLERNEFVFDSGDEDIHAAIERRLFETVGDVAGRLHTGRSRNDQVATDLRLYAKSARRVSTSCRAAMASMRSRHALLA